MTSTKPSLRFAQITANLLQSIYAKVSFQGIELGIDVPFNGFWVILNV